MLRAFVERSLHVVATLCALLPCHARALDVDGSLRVLNRFNVVRNGIETQILYDEVARRFLLDDYLSPTVDQAFSTHLVGATVDAALGGGWAFTLAGDTGLLRVGKQSVVDVESITAFGRRVRFPVVTTRRELALTSNGIPIADEAARSLFLREAYFTYSNAAGLRLAVGKRRVTIAEGFLYDQFAFGVGLRVGGAAPDLGAKGPRPRRSPWSFELDAILSDGSFDTGGKSSPIAHAGLRYSFGAFEWLALSVIYFHDGDDLLSEVFRTSVLETNLERAELRGTRVDPGVLRVPFSSSGDLVWFGATGRRFFGDHRVSFALFGQAGEATVSVLLPAEQTGGARVVRSVTTSAPGMLFDVLYQYDFTEDLVAGAFFTFASGDDAVAPTRSSLQGGAPTLGAFLSIFPFVTRTNLFFNGGLNAESSQRRASTLGVSARGLIVGGAFARWDGKHARLEARIAALGAHKDSIYGGQYYGTELDLNARIPIRSGVSFVLELDTLWTGDFFARQRPLFQAIAGFDWALP